MASYKQGQVSSNIIEETMEIIETLREQGEIDENYSEFHYLVKGGECFCVLPSDDWGNPGYVIALKGDDSHVVETLPAQEPLH